MTISNTSQPLFDDTTASAPETFAMAALSKLLQLTPTGPPGWGTIFKIFFVLMALINIKNIPLTWHVSFSPLHPPPSPKFLPLKPHMRFLY